MSDIKKGPKAESEWSWLRRNFWPIYPEETATVFCMVCMLALALFNYTCLRINKDALILGAPCSDQDVFPYLKFFFVLPSTVFFITFYWSMSNKLSVKNLFYVTLLPFIVFYLVFALFINPFVHILHASPATITRWQIAYPRVAPLAAVFGNWGYSMFYVWAELWINAVVAILFWTFANALISKTESKRIFPIIATYANLGLIAGGLIARHFSLLAIEAKKHGVKYDSTGPVLYCIVVSAVLFAAVYWYLNSYILASNASVAVQPKKKATISLYESAQIIFSSKYLMYITILGIAYGTSTNLVEVTWKGMVKELYKEKDLIKIFMCNFFVLTGLSTILIGFTCKNVVRYFGWLFGSLVTPLAVLVTSVAFYVFVVFGKFVLPINILAGVVFYSVIIGAIQNILSKGCKYTVFDPTIQMSYQPLDPELKIKGKAAVDVIAGRGGKSLGSVLQLIISFLIPTVAEAAGSFGRTQYKHLSYMLLVVMLCVAWIYASIALSKEYTKLLEEGEKGTDTK